MDLTDSKGSVTREVVDGKLANVLRGSVSLENNGGFVQMATDLALDPSVSRTVDMSSCKFQPVLFS
jgi:hypothetical protein